MTSKEFIKNEIDNLKDMLKNAKDLNCESIIKCSKEEIEQYNQVLKDLSTKDALLKFAIPFLATFTDMDGKIRICNYHTYVEELKQITIMKPISEEDFNLIKEAWENEL